MKRILFALLVAIPIGCAVGAEPTNVPPAGDPPSTTPPPEEDTGTKPPEDAPTDPPPPQKTLGEAGKFDKTIAVDGVSRRYTLWVSASARTKMDAGPVPMLVALHGAGDTGQNFANALALPALGNVHAFVILAPDAYKKAWFLSSSEGWTKPDGNSTSLQNDIALLLSALEETKKEYAIDDKRVFLAGFSRGAGLTAGLATASENPSVLGGKYESPFAAFGVCAGYDPFSAVPGYSANAAMPKRPVWIIHGTSDGAVPFAEGKKLADTMQTGGWPVQFTSVTGAPHNWLWSAMYGHSNEELWSWMEKNARE